MQLSDPLRLPYCILLQKKVGSSGIVKVPVYSPGASTQPHFSLGHMKVVETLLFAGATVDAVNDAGLTPLMLAILSHHVEVALLLVMNAADVTVSSPEQQSCLHFASKSFPCEQGNACSRG